MKNANPGRQPWIYVVYLASAASLISLLSGRLHAGTAKNTLVTLSVFFSLSAIGLSVYYMQRMGRHK